MNKITVEFLFAVIQSIFAVLALILSLLLYFNLLNVQSSLNIPNEALTFYIVMFLLFGFIFLSSGLFLIYEWYELQ